MKQKRTIYFSKATGRLINGMAEQVRVPSPWKPGRSRNKNKFNKR